ncbi:hypothetical protein K7432_008949 [Basidiobolus ranarum]|uniref:F-box domain-containing protein n=1 Tax=Basidiobolus ranarum TaxID=34480 RepID=A0ABR2VXV9_9FUNG
MSVFPQEVLGLIFSYHTSPQELISVCSFFYQFSKRNTVRANWLWEHQNFFGVFPNKTSCLVRPHALVTPNVALSLLCWALSDMHRLQEPFKVAHFLSHLNFRYEFDFNTMLENPEGKVIEKIGILLVQSGSIHSEDLMKLLFERLNLSGPIFVDCVLEQIEVCPFQKYRRTALRLVILASRYRKDKSDKAS